MLLDIAAGMGDLAAVVEKRQALSEYLHRLDADQIKGGWSFAGTRHFLAGREAFAAYGWLDAAIRTRFLGADEYLAVGVRGPGFVRFSG